MIEKSTVLYWEFVSTEVRIALVQMAVGETKSTNIKRAVQLIREAAGGGAQLIALPECFNSPYGTSQYLHSELYQSVNTKLFLPEPIMLPR